MKRSWIVFSAVLILLLGGCATSPGLRGNDQALPLDQVDLNLQKQLPVTRKASFGSVKIVGMLLQSSLDKKSMEIPVKFVLTSYEIPEGIEGLIVYRGGLRYVPETRTLYLSDPEPLRLTFGNPSLEEYVSASARKGIAALVGSALQSLPLQTMPESFRAHTIEKFAIEKEKLLIDFK